MNTKSDLHTKSTYVMKALMLIPGLAVCVLALYLLRLPAEEVQKSLLSIQVLRGLSVSLLCSTALLVIFAADAIKKYNLLRNQYHELLARKTTENLSAFMELATQAHEKNQATIKDQQQTIEELKQRINLNQSL